MTMTTPQSLKRRHSCGRGVKDCCSVKIDIPSSSSSSADSPICSGERLRLSPRGPDSADDGGSTPVTHIRSTLAIATTPSSSSSGLLECADVE